MRSVTTKYTKVTIDVDDIDASTSSFGYICIEFDVKSSTNAFFMETNDLAILAAVRYFFKSKLGYKIEKDIYIEDTHIMINLMRIEDKMFTPDMVQLIKEFENKFDQKVINYG